MLEKLRPVEGARVIRAEYARPDDRRRAYFSIGPETDPGMREGDFALDMAVAMERFPLFPAGTPQA